MEDNSNMLDKITEVYYEENLLTVEGFDEAVIGIDVRSMRLIYSIKKGIEVLMKDMSYEEALDYLHYNVIGSYVGENTPIWCEDDFE